jgi:hypothetical protein
MIVTLDRRQCPRWQAACESCFATRLIQNNFDVADCCLRVTQDSRPAMEFDITDRDGSHKVLNITADNRADAMDSWLLLWQQQAGQSS